MPVNLRKNMFLEKNYMKGLNKIADEIGDVLVDPIQDSSTAITVSDGIFNFTVSTSIESTTVSLRETFSTNT
uniref:Uncharacterized protein n=1 Tax=Angiostrongylus cantonensis TaxID=6313 RepID=C7BVU4_ANGCA|nr:hypothetical protein [Angiostrongylus cantonensis]